MRVRAAIPLPGAYASETAPMSDVMQRWIEVYQRESNGLIRFATTLVGKAAADDVVSDAMIRLLDRPETGRLGADEMTPYLYRTVANTAKNHLRSTSRRGRREERAARPFVALSNPAASSELSPPGAELSPEIVAAMHQLSTQQRAVIFLTYWSDLAPTDVASHLNVSTGTVKRQLARGRAKLGKALA